MRPQTCLMDVSKHNHLDGISDVLEKSLSKIPKVMWSEEITERGDSSSLRNENEALQREKQTDPQT